MNLCFILTASNTISLCLCASHVVTFTPDSDNWSLTLLYRVYLHQVDHKKRPFCLWKDIHSKPRQNCFGNWIEHCLHYTYLSRQWRHSRRHWEILDEEGTLLKSIYQKVTFHQSGCVIQDPVSRKSWWWASEYNGIEKLISFSLIRIKQKLTKTVTLFCWRLSCCLCRHYPGNDFLQDSVPSHRAKVTQQFLRQNTADFIAADEWVSYSPDLNLLGYCIWDILQDLVYEGQRLPFATLYWTSKRQSKTNGRSPLRQFENPLHNGKKRLNTVRKQNGGAIQHIFR